MKKTFIHKEIWLLTTMGGFQRANLYAKNVAPNEEKRKKFREALHIHIKNLAISQYTKQVNTDKHLANIKSVSQFTADCESSYLLNNGKLNFGVSQKLLNLYLKYLWCMDAIATPPHFPVDRIIQVNLNKEAEKLNKEAKKLNKEAKEEDLKKRTITAWTQMENESEYMEVINYATTVLEKSTQQNLAELELHLFERN